MKSTNALLLFSFPLFFAACGDDATDNPAQFSQSGLEVISNVSELPKCTKSNEGELVWVVNEITPRMCRDGKWFAVAEGNVTATCTTKELKDKSGVKIICGGDSVGVVLNGKDGRDGKDGVSGKDGADGKDGTDGAPGTNGKDGTPGAQGTGCSMEKIDENSVRVTCGSESAVLYVGGTPDTTTLDSVVLDSEKVAVLLDEVSGVTQKGPFLSGSKVLVRELEDGRALTQTGNSFNGKILNDRGEFKIKARMLVSQYVMLEASGYYRNEITGENSSSELTLFAITDVNERNTVNVNLLTHLEYERVIYLVTKKKMTVRAAKKQAQKEVFALLNIDATDFSNSEDLNIAGASDEDAALLAFSIIFQGDRSVSQLSELLQKIAIDMEEDGTWDNAAMRISLADWASEQETEGKMAYIRQNVTNWQLSSIVPNFERHIHKFWTTEYGLGNCADENEGEVLQNTNEQSKTNGTYFVCKSGKWTTASIIEIDTYQWEPGADGDVRSGDVTDSIYVFDKTAWRSGNTTDCSLGLRGCTALRQDTVGKGSDNVWYKCDAQAWRTATDIEKDTATWGAGEFDGEIRTGQVNKTIYYIFETNNNAWREATVLEYDTYDYVNNSDWADGIDGEIKKGAITDTIYVFDATTWRVADGIEKTLGGCTAAIQDSVGRYGRAYYICKPRNWTRATALEYDTYRVVCSEDGALFNGNVNTMIKYVCDSGVFREANELEKEADSACTVYNMGEYYILPRVNGNRNYSYYKCTKVGWLFTTDKLNQGTMTDERDGHVYKTIGIKTQMWMAENLNYADSVNYSSMQEGNWCYENDLDNCEKYGRLYTWTATIDANYWWGQGHNCIGGSAGARVSCNGVTNGAQGICPVGWHVPSKEQWNILIENVGGLSTAELVLVSESENGSDIYGFSAINSGYVDSWGLTNSEINLFNSGIIFWSSDEYDDTDYYDDPFFMGDISVYGMRAHAEVFGAQEYVAQKMDGYAVRCVKDEE